MTLKPFNVQNIGGKRWPQRNDVYHFTSKDDQGEFSFYIIASIVRPDEDIAHVGGTHTDSLHPLQKWQSLQDACEKIAAKAYGMEVKNRVQELTCAGCKFGIYVPKDSLRILQGISRVELFKRLGDVLNEYKGRLYTGADVNTDLFDLMITLNHSPYVLGKPLHYGGCGDPSWYTAEGIVRLQKEVILRFLAPYSPVITGKKITIKGAAGKVGSEIVSRLYDEGINLVVADINQEGINKIRHRYKGVEVQPPQNIHKTDAHIYCPADSTITVPSLGIAKEFFSNRLDNSSSGKEYFHRAILGPANDQCRSEEVDQWLFENHILHISMGGELENGGGVIAVDDEREEGGFVHERVMAKIVGGTYNEKTYIGLIRKGIMVIEESLHKKVSPWTVVKEMFLS